MLMSTSYYYYPTTRPTSYRASAPAFDRMSTSYTQRRSSVSPPPLSRSSTPSSSAPPTPTFQHAFPITFKMAPSKPQVGFASPLLTSSYRIPAYDERFVMRAFASHATHCSQCCDPERACREGQTLCRTGTDLARDIGKYFYCKDGKPFSTIDRDQRNDKVQVEVPVEYSIISSFFKALGKGLKLYSRSSRRPEIHQSKSTPAPTRASNGSRNYEIKPSSSSSRRQRSNTYTGYSSAQYETRSPNDYEERRREPSSSRSRERRSSQYISSTSTSSDDRKNRRKSYVYSVPR